jgi:hypothetical protein
LGFTELQDTVGIGLARCHYQAGSPALTITRFTDAAPRGGQREPINGIPVITCSSDGLKDARIVFSTLGAVLTANDAAAAHIITTLQRSLSTGRVEKLMSQGAWRPPRGSRRQRKYPQRVPGSVPGDHRRGTE